MLLLLLLLLSLAAAAAGDSVDNANCSVQLQPNSVFGLTVGQYLPLNVNCSCCQQAASSGLVVMVTVYMANAQVAAVTKSSVRLRQSHTALRRTCSFGRLCTFKELPYQSPTFVEANNVGRERLKVQLVAWNVSSWKEVLRLRRERVDVEGLRQELGDQLLSVVTVRRRRLIDAAFEWSAGCVACLLALCMGCVTDLAGVAPHFRRPLPLLAGLCVQHLVMPPVAFGLHHLFQLQADMGLGLVAIATMPGGGLAHLTVYLMSGDRHLSAAVSLANSVLNLGLCPAWLGGFTLSLGFKLRLHMVVLLLVPVCAAQVAGSLLATWRPEAADALLNWIGRPLLLLSAILMVTLGVYINHYAIDHLDARALLCVLAFIGAGFGLGGLAGIVVRQQKPQRKALAAEAACCSCLIAMPAIRAAGDAPTADLATILPLAASILTPAPIVIYIVAHRLKGFVANFIDKRKEKQSRHFSIVSSLAKMAEDVTAVSAPLAVDEGKEEEEEAAAADEEAGEKQKVTTL